MAMNNWWTNPLPAGWESRWDPGQKRYFFIDHSTKKTSWVDPRSPEGRYQVAQQQQSGYGASTSIPMQPIKVPSSTGNVNQVPRGFQTHDPYIAKASQAKCVMCSKVPVHTQGDTCTECMLKFLTQETSFTNQAEEQPETPDDHFAGMFVRADHQVFTKLKEAYPTAMDSHIRSALESNNNDENKASNELEKRGYKKVSQEEIKAEKVMEKLRPKYMQCGRELLKTTIISCNCDEAATRRKLKELGFLTREEQLEQENKEREQKRKRAELEQALHRDFPELSSTVINMALDSGDYDEAIVRQVLASLSSDKKSAAPKPKPETSAGQRPTSASKAGTSSAKQPAKASGKQPLKKKQPDQKPASKSTVAPQKRPTPVEPRLGITKPKPTAGRVVKSEEHVKRVHTSDLARGPDPTLPKGPQDSLLLKSYTELIGPNHDFVVGPNKDLVKGANCEVYGSQGACGPDHTLVKGPSAYSHMITV